MFFLVIILSFGASALVRQWMTRTYAKWSKVPNRAGVNGHTVARKILDSHGLNHVKLEVSKGLLTDHYVPSQKLMRLSQDINDAPSVASIAVAAHECGHALQDKEGYGPLKLKAVMMPLAAAGNQFGLMLTLGAAMFGSPFLMNTGLFMMLLGMLMPLLTLPIEFDASKRALQVLTDMQLVNEQEYDGAKSMLKAAALTYVAGAASSAAIVGLIMFRFFKR
jgi:Zn-dependent membrane protease YugP